MVPRQAHQASPAPRPSPLGHPGLPGGEVFSRHSITYHGHPAEDAVISVLGDPGQIRIVAFGSFAYIFEGFGSTAASFAHDYKVLLDSFRLLHP